MTPSPDRRPQGAVPSERLDLALVARGLSSSRSRAAAAVRAGRVRVDGRPARRPAEPVAAEDALTLDHDDDWASRAGAKLAGALDRFGGPDPRGRRCLDAGASTGGFTDVLLRRGASRVVAVDVGRGQLRPELAGDPRVDVHDGVNVRDLDPQDIGGPVEFAVADLSFIALSTVLPALLSCVRPGGDVVPLVKPQFEVGRHLLGRGGVVRDDALRADAAWGVADRAARLGWGTRAVADSVLPGPAGNREVLLWLRTDAPPPDRAAFGAALGAAPNGSGTR